MKILFIPMLPTLYGRRYQICKHLVSSGHEVHMILWDMPYPVNYQNLISSLKRAWRKDEYRKDGIYIHKVRRLPFFFPLVNRFWFHQQLKKISSDFTLEAVISQSFFNETEPPRDLPLFFDLNDNYEAFGKIYGSFVYRVSYKLLRVRKTVESQLTRSTAVFAVSDMLVNYGKRFNPAVYKVPNGVDITLKDIKKPSSLSYGPHSLVYVSTFGKWSRILEVISLVKKMSLEMPDIKLLLIGTGTEFNEARNLIKNLKAEESVRLLGSIYDRKKLFEIIQNCKVCLNISEKNEFRDSASPIKIYEYSAFGKVVVSTNLSEVVELHFPNILTYDYNKESSELEASIKKAFRLRGSNSWVQKEVLKKYNWASLTNKMVHVMEEGWHENF